MESLSNYFFIFSQENFECIIEQNSNNESCLKSYWVFFRKMFQVLIVDSLYAILLQEKGLLEFQQTNNEQREIVDRLRLSILYKAFKILTEKYFIMQDQIFGSDFALYKSWEPGQTKHSNYLLFINPQNLIRVQRVSHLNKKKILIAQENSQGEVCFLKIKKPK